MYIGGSLVMIALGAILSFAVRDNLEAVDLTMVGYILLGVGALGIILSLVLPGRRTPRDELPPR